ncbi:Dipeptide transport system permease protein DppB [Thermoflexales bacterium]|nr:Dipeptide transport system permease protein DppB [Thermoflexales bacterium]
MGQYFLRRMLLTIPVLIGIVFITFVLVRAIPGDPCRAMMGEKASQASCEAFKVRFGLNDNVVVQFGRYAGNLLQGDFGNSIKYGRPVSTILLERLPATLELALAAMAFAVLLGIPLGIISAYRHNSPFDAGTMVVANLGVSMPIFWLGLLLAAFFGVVLKDTPLQLPTGGRLSAGISIPPLTDLKQLEGFSLSAMTFLSNMVTLNALVTGNWKVLGDAVRHLILPAIALGTIPMAIIARMTRSNLLDVLGLDYVRTARAKGVKERSVVLKHGLRNAMLPLVTVIGLQFGALLGGAVLTETVFGLPGVGKFLVDSIFARDYPVVQGFTLVIAVIFVIVNLIVDISYAYLDPRVRLN